MSFHNKLTNLANTIENLGGNLGIDLDYKNKSSNRTATDNNKTIKYSAPIGEKGAGGNMKDNQIWSRIAERYAAENADEVIHSTTFADKVGNKIVLSTDGSITALKNDTPVDWPIRLSNAQITRIHEGDTSIGWELLENFKTASAKDNTRLAEWTPNHDEEDVKEKQLEPLHKGTTVKVKENLLRSEEAAEYKRNFNPEKDNKTREETIKEKHEGTEIKSKELQLREDAGLYKRRGTDDDVREHLIEDARLGNPDITIEEQLESVRNNYGLGKALSVMHKATNAFGRAVVAAKVTPEEIVDAIKVLASKEDLTDLITLASLGSKRREIIASRKNYHGENLPTLSALASILNEIGKEVDNEVFAADLAVATRVSADETEKSIVAIDKAARQYQNTNEVSNNIKVSKNREQEMKAALTAQASVNNDLDESTVSVTLYALAHATRDAGSTPEEVWAEIANTEHDELLSEVAYATTQEALASREKEFKRIAYWQGRGIKVANTKSLHDVIIESLADGIIANSASVTGIVNTACKISNNSRVAEIWLSKAIDAVENEMKRTAEIEVTDEETSTKRLICRAEDLNGLDPKSPDFADHFRDAAVSIFQNQGYDVDPSTFSFTNLNISKDGSITAEITSRFSKTFVANSASSTSVDVDTTTTPAVDTGYNGGASEPEVVALPEGGSTTENPADDSTVITAAARKHLSKKAATRNNILKKLAQFAPNNPAPGGASGMGGGDATASGADAAGGLGIGSFTAPTDAGDNPVNEPTDSDDMPTPGEKAPWGTICPACGSKDTDVSGENGKCNNCNTEWVTKVHIEINPGTEDTTPGGKGPEDKGPDLSEIGLGGATAPTPAPEPAGANGAPPAGAPMPGATANSKNKIVTASNEDDIYAMFRTSYKLNPEVFVKFTTTNLNRHASVQLPNGYVCPACGDRNAIRVANKNLYKTFCNNCETESISKITTASDNMIGVEVLWHA